MRGVRAVGLGCRLGQRALEHVGVVGDGPHRGLGRERRPRRSGDAQRDQEHRDEQQRAHGGCNAAGARTLRSGARIRPNSGPDPEHDQPTDLASCWPLRFPRGSPAYWIATWPPSAAGPLSLARMLQRPREMGALKWRALVSPDDRVGIKVTAKGGRYFSTQFTLDASVTPRIVTSTTGVSPVSC